MPSFGVTSNKRLEGVHPELRKLARTVVAYIDCSVIYGKRTQEEQKQLVEEELSKTMNSLHLPQWTGYAHAIDLAPYPIDWNDRERFVYMQGMIRGIAQQLNIKVRSGIDWDSDGTIKDHSFFDGPHFELDD